MYRARMTLAEEVESKYEAACGDTQDGLQSSIQLLSNREEFGEVTR